MAHAQIPPRHTAEEMAEWLRTQLRRAEQGLATSEANWERRVARHDARPDQDLESVKLQWKYDVEQHNISIRLWRERISVYRTALQYLTAEVWS